MNSHDYNFLENNKFTFSMERLPETMFRVISIDLPAINVPAPDAGYPGATQYFPGTFTEFDELTLRFIVDENLKNYGELYDWITQQRFAEHYIPKNDTEIKLVSDGSLHTMTNASNPNRVFHFKDLFPISLGSLSFDTTINSPEAVVCQAVFKFSYFVLKSS